MNTAIKIYIVEDMAISRMHLEKLLLKNEYQLVGSSAKAETAWKDLQQLETDLVLLDINLAGEKNGIWLAEKIRKFKNMPFIYLTAYGDQQTIKEVLATNPNGYLMKPYLEPTLLTTITIAFTNFLKTQKNTLQSETATAFNNVIFIKDKFIRIKLHIDKIFYIKSEGNYLEICLENKTHVVRSRIADYLDILPSTIFCQVHSRYIVNCTKIDVIGKDFVTINNEDIPISRKYKKEIEQIISIL